MEKAFDFLTDMALSAFTSAATVEEGGAKAQLILQNGDTEVRDAIADIYRTVIPDFFNATLDEVSPERAAAFYLKRAFLEDLIANLLEFAGQLIRNTMGIWLDRLQEVMASGIEQELTIDEIATNLRQEFKVLTADRAEMISRTEVVSSSNYAAFEGAKAAPIPLNKEYISSRDNRTRTRAKKDKFEHYEADGEIVALMEPFTRTGEPIMYPGDPEASAANRIRCRCTLGFHAIR